MPYKSKEAERACRVRNNHKKLAYMKEYRAANLERENARAKKWQQDNKERFAESLKTYAKSHPEVNKAAAKRYREKNQSDPKWRARNARWAREKRAANPGAANAYSREYSKRRYHADIEYRLTCNLRSRLHKKLRSTGGKKFMSALDLTGCTTEFLRGYIEAMFRDGMNWNNIHIDHIVPIAAFDLTNEDDQRKCFHYSNLQPLFGAENMAKGAKALATAAKRK